MCKRSSLATGSGWPEWRTVNRVSPDLDDDWLKRMFLRHSVRFSKSGGSSLTVLQHLFPERSMYRIIIRGYNSEYSVMV